MHESPRKNKSSLPIPDNPSHIDTPQGIHMKEGRSSFQYPQDRKTLKRLYDRLAARSTPTYIHTFILLKKMWACEYNRMRETKCGNTKGELVIVKNDISVNGVETYKMISSCPK